MEAVNRQSTLSRALAEGICRHLCVDELGIQRLNVI